MFALLKINENETGFFKRLKFRISPPEPELSRINVKGAAPFYFLTIYENQCGENFCEIVDILGRCAQNLITCGEYTLPDNPLIKRYYPSLFPQLLLMNSACGFVRGMDKSLRLSVALIDKKAQLCGYAETLVQSASTVIIVTDFPEKYENTSNYIYDEWGASIIVTANLSLITDCDVVISPFANIIRKYNCSVVYKDRQKNVTTVLKGKHFTLPEEYRALMPFPIDDLLFASALYELCGAKELKNLKYDSLCKEGT